MLRVLCAVFATGLPRWTAPEIGMVPYEMVVFVTYRGHCRLSRLAEVPGAKYERVSDIFLSRWCANRFRKSMRRRS